MLIGYMRVSKADGSQVLDMQKDALLSSGVTEDRIYSDTQSGSRFDTRPGLQNCLKALQPGNTLVIWKLDRLGRSLKDLVNIVEELRTSHVKPAFSRFNIIFVNANCIKAVAEEAVIS